MRAAAGPQPGLVLRREVRQFRGQVDVEVRPVAGPVAGHPGDADPPPAATAADPHYRASPAAGSGPALRRLQPLACLVLEADDGAQVARGAFISGHTSAFHTATAASSRSIAWRTGTWQDQPCRRSSFQAPPTVYPMWNSLPISVLILPRVQRWSTAKPCQRAPPQLGSQPGPLPRAQPLPRHRPSGPQRRGPAIPPGLPPPPYRPLRDPQVRGDRRSGIPAREPPGRSQPEPFTSLPLGRCVPAALPIPHALVIGQCTGP